MHPLGVEEHHLAAVTDPQQAVKPPVRKQHREHRPGPVMGNQGEGTQRSCYALSPYG